MPVERSMYRDGIRIMRYHAVVAMSKSSGCLNHVRGSSNVKMLLKAEWIESRLANVGNEPEAVASLQKSWANAIDMEKTRLAFTRKANAVPIAIFISCLETADPNIDPVDTGCPSRCR